MSLITFFFFNLPIFIFLNLSLKTHVNKKGKKVVFINCLIRVICISAFVKYTDQLFVCRRVYLFSVASFFSRKFSWRFFSIYLIVLADFLRYRIFAKPQFIVSHQWKTIWSKNLLIDWLITPLYVNIFNKSTFYGKNIFSNKFL